jgi:hypothetical protein
VSGTTSRGEALWQLFSTAARGRTQCAWLRAGAVGACACSQRCTVMVVRGCEQAQGGGGGS